VTYGLPVGSNDPGAEGTRQRRFTVKRVLGWLAGLAVVGVAAGAALFAVAYFTTEIPEVNEVAAAQATIVYWNDGEREIARLGDTNRISVPLSDVPEDVQFAVLSAEDRSFYEHWGFDVVGIARAFWNNLTSSSTSGGSTITQQLAKNAFLTSEQTLVRKFREAVLTVKLEVELTKEQILEDYLNIIFYGRGAYGIQTAGEAYFRTDAKDLTLEQGAVLASVINAPGLYNPDDEDGRSRLENRYAYVLNGMVEEGWLDATERDAALEAFPEISERRKDQRYGGPRGFLLRSVEEELVTLGFTEEQIAAGGLRVVTTFDRQAQRAAQAAVAAEAPTTGMEGVRIGLAAVAPLTGEVVAMYGGADYLEDSFNNATQAQYQAGSTFKPFGLVAATQEGIGLDSLWPGNNGTEVAGYTVNNYGDNSYGELITLLRGTEQSVNTVYVSMADDTGVPPIREAALDTGIPADTPGIDNTDLTFVLGTASPHTVDVAFAYATFAARGERPEAPTTIRSVATASGDLLHERETRLSRALDRDVADVVNYALQRVVTNGTGAPARAVGRPVAGKTGTTDEYRSSWFAGYAPQLAAAVSFGRTGPNGEELSLSGVGGMTQFFGSGYPARIWTAFMRGALEGTEVLTFPEPVDPPSGGGASVPPSASASPSPTETESPTPTGTATPTPSPTATPSPTPSPTQEPTPTPTPTPTQEPTDEATDAAEAAEAAATPAALSP
jgi:membrane peptidoglycan carboxypeptidase